MPRRQTLNTLLLRKQLLVTEAELHREQMSQDLRIVGRAVDGLAKKAKTVGTAITVATVLVGGVSALRGVRKSVRNGKPSIFSRLFSGVRLATTMWQGWNSIHRTRSHSPFDDHQ